MTFDHRFELATSYGGTFHDNFGKLAELENSPFSSPSLHLWHFPSMSLVRQVTTVLCLQQSRQSQIQSQAWRDSLNHLEGRQGWPSISMWLLVSEIFVVPRACLRAWKGNPFSTQDGEQRNHPTPLPIPRPIMSQRRVVLTRGYPRSRGFLLSHPF